MMIEIRSRWKSGTDRAKRATRGASFLAKAKATKVVWFPPKPVETGKKAASKATNGTRNVTNPLSRKKKTTNGTRNMTNPLRRKKTTNGRR